VYGDEVATECSFSLDELLKLLVPYKVTVALYPAADSAGRVGETITERVEWARKRLATSSGYCLGELTPVGLLIVAFKHVPIHLFCGTIVVPQHGSVR
jgi:hypothetical protein